MSRLIPTAFVLLLLVGACKKESDFLTGGDVRLSFSEDTILFDTVFTTIGSTTEYLLVYNDASSAVRISTVRLARGAASAYRINVDGVPGPTVHDVVIGPKDSLWIFVEVTIDPNNSQTPFLVTDSILFEGEGTLQDVDLLAFGQNAIFHIADKSFLGLPYSLIDGDTVPPCSVIEWDSLLPHVVYGYAVLDSCYTLRIHEGTKVYFYQGAGLWVYRYGTLEVLGSVEHPVTFQGTRLEPAYDDVPGQWDRIWINEGGPANQHKIQNAVIRNSFIGLQPENFLSPLGQNQATLEIRNTIVQNASGIGMLARDYTVSAYNLVVGNCGSNNLALTIGGSYTFNQCTFANYFAAQRSAPAVYINNFYNGTSGTVGNDLVKAEFKNCIIYGSADNELELEFVSSALQEHHFYDCLLKVDGTTPVSDPAHFEDIVTNSDPLFNAPGDNDFELEGGSPAVDSADPAWIVPGLTSEDFFGRDRTADPDLGAYERQ
jgi:hypothetical protein